jgi:prepilin-type N-terminal cleavage/methylation domain-containing protein
MQRGHLQMLKQIRKSKEGFTIIEVMIVLAIAALILLVVFLAVPALQRSQRNNARKSDASRVAAAIVDFTSNSSTSSLPVSCTDWDSIYNSSANLAQFTGMSCAAFGASALPSTEAGQTDKRTYGTTTAANYTAPAPTTAYKSIILVGSGVKCNGTNAFQTSGATSRSVAMLYTIESGSTYSWACVEPQ